MWTSGDDGEVLVPVGKAYFGFTDEELVAIDRFVRRNTVERSVPVREVVHAADRGLVMEVAFEGLQRSARHRSGLAMRFPRISRLRWDKPPGEADRLETLERMIEKIDATRQHDRSDSEIVLELTPWPYRPSLRSHLLIRPPVVRRTTTRSRGSSAGPRYR